MKYNELIKLLQKELNEEGIRITQDKLKKIFEVTGDIIIENIKEEERMPLKEFIIFKLITIPKKKMPNGEWTDEQLSVKIEMSEVYKKRIKDRLNNK